MTHGRFDSSLCLCLCLCLLPGGKGTARRRRDTSPQALPDQQRSCPCLSLVISCFPNSTFLICLFEPWRRQAFASQASPRQVDVRTRVGLPTPDKLQKMTRGSLQQCSIPSTTNSRPLAASCCHSYRTTKLAWRLSQLHHHWTSHNWLRSSTNLLGTTRHHSPMGVQVQYRPSGNDLTPRAGEPSNSSAIVDAQWTLPISRDDDAPMQDAPCDDNAPLPEAPTVHDIATHVAKLVADVASGSSAHSRLQTNENVLPAVNSHCAYVHAPVSHWGVAHDHEVHPKHSTDQDAVETAARQRDCVIRAAADLFGREEALRLDEEIMDFQWYDTITWDCIKDLRATTYVQPPPRFKFALQQEQHVILRAITHHGRRLCSAAGSSWDGPLSTRRRATAHTSWMRDWSFFGQRIGLLSGPWYSFVK